MKQVRLEQSKDAGIIAQAIRELMTAKATENEAAKIVKAAKQVIREQLIQLRGIDVDTLPEGETVLVTIPATMIASGLKVDRKGSDRFDLASFRVSNPDMASKYVKRSIASYFEPLA